MCHLAGSVCLTLGELSAAMKIGLCSISLTHYFMQTLLSKQTKSSFLKGDNQLFPLLSRYSGNIQKNILPLSVSPYPGAGFPSPEGQHLPGEQGEALCPP